MANVNIKFNNKDYLLSCDDGQEESLKKLTSFLNKKYIELKEKLGNIGENKHAKLLREQKYLKDKLTKLQEEVNRRSELEEKFNQDIDELNQETEELVEEIEKWQT